MTNLPELALRSAKTPDRLMEELEKFIEFWIGPRREEFGVPGVVLGGLQLPAPLRRLYSFAGRWKIPHPKVEEEVDIFSIEDHLRPAESLELTPDGKLIFLDENQGNWSCATFSEGDDPPVWVEDVFNIYGQGKWGRVTESLSRFLVTFCLKELLFGSTFTLGDKGLEQLFESSKAEAIPLWTEGAYPNSNKDFSFYLLHGSVLVGDLGGGIWFGANHEEGIQFLESHQGEIREVGLAQECSWSLDIRPDGSAKVTFPNRFDSSAFAPPGTFDFASVRDQLRAVCTEVKPRTNPWYVTFPRFGQTSCFGQGIDDARLAGALFRRAIEAVVSKEAAFDDLMQDFPPQL
jgi:hypothetical protein